MSIILKKHYPASRLPDDLKKGLPKGSKVHIKIVSEERHPASALADLVGSGENVHGNEADVVHHVSEGRADR